MVLEELLGQGNACTLLLHYISNFQSIFVFLHFYFSISLSVSVRASPPIYYYLHHLNMLICMDSNKLYIKLMSNMFAFMWYLSEHNGQNIAIDMQGFTTPPSFSRKSKMADKDGRKRTLLDQISQWEQQKLFSRHFQDSKYVGQNNTFFGGW